jgi:hypothetical protein
MKMNKGGGEFPKAPEGVHQAACYGVVDIGTQKSFFKGKEKKAHKVVVLFEFAKLRLDDGRPMVLSAMYTASLGDRAKLYKHLKSWKGRAMTQDEKDAFESSMLIGKNCMLQIIHNESDGTIYANVENILPIMEGMEVYQPENDKIDYELQPGYIPEGMYDWLADKIRASDEWNDAPDGEGYPDEESQVEPF